MVVGAVVLGAVVAVIWIIHRCLVQQHLTVDVVVAQISHHLRRTPPGTLPLPISTILPQLLSKTLASGE